MTEIPDLTQATKDLKLLDGQVINIDLHLTIAEALALLGTIQLACRHPHFSGPARDIAKRFGLRIQACLNAFTTQAIAGLAAAGWDPEFDYELEGEDENPEN